MPESDSLERRLRALADRPGREGGTGGLDGGQVLYAARRHHRRRTALTAAVLVAAVAIGIPLGTRLLGPVTASNPAIPAASSSLATSTNLATGTSAGVGQELYGHGTVLAKPGEEPVLCLGVVLTSAPPQCDGPPIVGWDWTKAPAEVGSYNGYRWVDAYVVGTYDGTHFTLTRPPVGSLSWTGPTDVETPDGQPTPCPPPPGGWKVVDPAKTTARALLQAGDAAHRLPGYVSSRWDTAPGRALPAPSGNATASAVGPGAPLATVLTVWVSEDAAGAERTLRSIWGGMLCVITPSRSSEDVQRDIDRLSERASELGLLSVMSDQTSAVVKVVVVHDDGGLQRRLDADYGVGRVTVTSALKPMPAKAS